MDVTPEYYDARIAVNQRPAYFAIQAVVPGMKKMGGGSIINFGSNSYGAKGRNMSVYTTAKSSVIGLTRGLAAELGEHRIRINVITPGWIMTAAPDREVADTRGRGRDQAQPGAARQGASRRRDAAGAVPRLRRRARLFGAGIHRGRGVVVRLLQFLDAGRRTRRARRRERRGAAADAIRDYLSARAQGAQRAQDTRAAGRRRAASMRRSPTRTCCAMDACCRRSRIRIRRIAWSPAPASRTWAARPRATPCTQRSTSRTPNSPTP